VKPQFTRAVVTILLLIAIYVLSANKFNVSAQSCDFPALTSWYRIFYDSWRPGSTVQVFIDDRFNETDRNQLIHGIQNWNLYSDVDCSGVTFDGCAWHVSEIEELAKIDQRFHFRRVAPTVFEVRPLDDPTATDDPHLENLLPANRPEEVRRCFNSG